MDIFQKKRGKIRLDIPEVNKAKEEGKIFSLNERDC